MGEAALDGAEADDDVIGDFETARCIYRKVVSKRIEIYIRVFFLELYGLLDGCYATGSGHLRLSAD